MIATILTTARPWLVELDGAPGDAFPKLWKQIQAGKPIVTVFVTPDGVPHGSFPVLFNAAQVVAIHEHLG
jgi:hypothetical protein